MKWVTFISCLFLISFAESKYLSRKYRDVELHDSMNHYRFLEPEKFGAIAMALFSQTLQKAEFTEVAKETTDVTEVFKKCKADATSDAACGKHMGEVFRDEICHEAEVAAKLGLTECCAKADPERKDCILSHKNESKEFIPPYQRPTVEEGCKLYAENKAGVIAKYIYEVARRSPMVNVIVILNAAKKYDTVMETCCHAEDKDACFLEKATAVKKEVKKQVLEQQIACSIMKKPGRRALGAMKLAYLGQKFPKISFENAVKITEDIIHIHEHVCKGDTLEAMTERAELVDFMCNHKDEIGSNLGPCCEMPVLARSACIVGLENDAKPDGLSPTVEGFIEDPETCKHFHDDGEKHLAKFEYEYARRHPEFSPSLIVRAAKGYEDLLKKCCAAENSKECLHEGEAQLKKHIADTMEFLNTNCGLHESLGDYQFQNLLLALYSKKAPQLSNEELIKITGQMKDIAKECCHLDDSHKLVCAETKTDVVLGAICLRHQHHPINHQVCQCCSDSFSFRRECLSGLGVDPQYVPVPFEPEFHEDLCSTDENKQHTEKQNLLISLVKHKPDISIVQQEKTTVDFNTMLDHCCKAENHEACFKEEGPKLIEKVKQTLGEH